MKRINLSKPASQIWSIGFFLCLVCTFIYFYLVGHSTVPTIASPINIIELILNYWIFSLPLSIVGFIFFIRYYLILKRKYKSNQKEYLSIISTMLMLALFPSIVFGAALLEITSSYFAFIPTALIIACLVIINILKNFKQTSF